MATSLPSATTDRLGHRPRVKPFPRGARAPAGSPGGRSGPVCTSQVSHPGPGNEPLSPPTSESEPPRSPPAWRYRPPLPRKQEPGRQLGWDLAAMPQGPVGRRVSVRVHSFIRCYGAPATCQALFRRPGVERTPRRKSRLRGVRGAVGDMDNKREQTKCTACWMTAHAKEKHRAGAEQGVHGPAPKPLDEGSRRFASHRGGLGRPPQMGRLSRRDGSEAAGGPGGADAGAPPPRGSVRKPVLQGQNGPGGRARKSGRQSGRGSGVGPGRS